MMEFDQQSAKKMEGLKKYRATSTVHAIKIRGPFRVKNGAVAMTCQDGYLVVNEDGHAFPIRREQMEKTYVEVPE